MAARTAFLRQSYADSRGYLTNLIDSACSPDVVAEAWIMLGDRPTVRVVGGAVVATAGVVLLSLPAGALSS